MFPHAALGAAGGVVWTSTATRSRRAAATCAVAERELVPVATLERDAAFDDAEEPAAAQPKRIAPLQDRPLAVLEQVLDDARHRGRRELALEHRADVRPPLDRRPLGHLMVDRVDGVQRG